jgi:hypothetical protein
MAVTVGMIFGLIGPTVSTVAQTSQGGAFTVSAVVRRGDPTTNGGTFFDCDFCDVNIAGEHGLNDSGQVVIYGFADGCSGVYVVSGRTGFRVVDVCRPTPFGRLSLYAGANINNRGQVAMNVGPAVNNRVVDMVLLHSDGQFQKVAAEGDLSPTGKGFGYCGFSRPSINDNGEIGFSACFQDNQGTFNDDGIFTYSEGNLRKIVVGHDPAPVGGQFAFAFVPPPRVTINDNGDVLFMAGQYDPDNFTMPERFGLFLATADGMKKIELSRDTMPNGSQAADNSFGIGTLNNKGDVVFGLRLAGKPRVGYFLYSGEQTSTIILDGQTTPIGGSFDLTQDVEDIFGPRINDNGTVALMANVTGGSSSEAIFLASPTAILKVVGIGDRLPSGEKIRSLSSFAFNNLGQVAFVANASPSAVNPQPLGVFLASPAAPAVASIKLKQKKGGLQLRVSGAAMIANDTVIEINGVALGQTSYPAEFQEDGGTITQLISRDARLEQLLPPGQPAQVTVFNPLTNQRSAAVAFTR